MKHSLVIAVAGGMMMHAAGLCDQGKKHNAFSKADKIYHERRCCAKSEKVKDLRTYQVV